MLDQLSHAVTCGNMTHHKPERIGDLENAQPKATERLGGAEDKLI
jgi:hypothetical protein